MTIQTINLGTYPNDGTGDDLRTAFTKVNDNFALLDQEINVANGANVGSGVGIFKQKSTTDLQFKSLISTNHSITFTATDDMINLASTAKVESDDAPALGGDLDVAGYKIVDSSVDKTGDLQTTVFGIDVPIVNALLELMLISNAINVDLGRFTITNTISYPTLDMGYFTGITYPNNNLDFGYFV